LKYLIPVFSTQSSSTEERKEGGEKKKKKKKEILSQDSFPIVLDDSDSPGRRVKFKSRTIFRKTTVTERRETRERVSSSLLLC